MLMFNAFRASSTRTETLCADLHYDDGLPERGGFIFDRGCYIEDNTAGTPEFTALGKFYLLIERSDWVSDDLDYLARILWAYHYLFETTEPVALAGDDLNDFIQGYSAATKLRVDGDVLAHAFSGGTFFTPHEAETIIRNAAKLAA